MLTKTSESPSSSPPIETEMNTVCEQDLILDNTTPEVPLLAPLITQEVPLMENPSSQEEIQPEVLASILENPVLMEITITETADKQADPLPEASVVQPPEESDLSSLSDVSVSQDAALQQDSSLVAPESEYHVQAPPTQSSPEPCLDETKEPAPEPVEETDSIEGTLSTTEVQTNGISEEVSVPPAQLEPPPVCHSEPTIDSPIAQPEELLTNGEGSPALKELDAHETEQETHVSPIAEPEEQKVAVVDPVPQEEDTGKEPPAESEQTPVQAPKQSSDVPVPGKTRSVERFKGVVNP